MANPFISITANIKPVLNVLEKASKNATKGMAKSSLHAAAIINKNAKEIVGIQRKLIRLPNGSHTWEKPSLPGQPPKRRTGRLQKSLRYEADGQGARLFSLYTGTGKRRDNGFLARLMEDGTSKMKPRPFMQRAVNKSLSRLPLLFKTTIATAMNS